MSPSFSVTSCRGVASGSFDASRPAPGSQGVVLGRDPAMPGSIGFFIIGMIIIALGAVPAVWSIAIPAMFIPAIGAEVSCAHAAVRDSARSASPAGASRSSRVM